MTELWQESAAALAARVAARDVSALEVADAHLERALHCNDRLGAFLHLEPERAQMLGHQGLGAGLVKPQLGVAVQILADPGQSGFEITHAADIRWFSQ